MTSSENRPLRIALVAHDARKPALAAWALRHRERLAQSELCATGTTGTLIEKEISHPVHKYKSGPLGGDLQIGAQIVEGRIDALIFFWDPLTSQPHDVDVKALLRLAVLYNIPMACNEATAILLLNNL